MKMKRSVQELADEVTIQTATGISTVQGKRWLQEILKAAKQKMFFEQFAYVSDAGKGIKDVEVPIATSNIDFTDSKTEGQERTLSYIDNLSTVTFTPTSHNFGAAVSAEVVRTSQVDVVRFARDQMAYDMALTIDTAFATELATATPAATLYGGDATNTATLAAGDVMTPEIVASAIRALKVNGWVGEPGKPLVAFISPYQEEALMKDSQFVNASEYGGNEIVMNGEIGRYLGVKIISTNQVPSSSTWGAGSNLDGNTCFVLKAKVSYGIIYAQRPKLDFEYKKDEAAHYVYLDTAYDIENLQEGAIVHIKVLQV